MMRRSIIILLAGLLGAVSAQAADRYGTADAFRQIGGAGCGASFAEQLTGACDPPPVDATLAPRERAVAHIGRARTLVALGRLDEARKAANGAVESDPQNVAALTFRARVAFSQRNLDAALTDLNAALTIEPQHPVALANRAAVLLDYGEKAAALADITRAVALAPDDVDTLWIKGRVYLALDRLDRAEEDFTRALAIEPDERRARLFRAQLRLRRGNFAGAIEDASVLIDQRSDMSALEVRAIAATALERHAEALADLERILGAPGEATPAVTLPHFAGMLMQRAVLLAALGRRAELAKDIDTLMRADGKRGVMRLQLYLRQHGFGDVALDGERSGVLDEALTTCLAQRACARGLSFSQRS